MSGVVQMTDWVVPGSEPHPADVMRMQSIRMKFGPVEVLKSVSISVRRAEVLGLLGQNGSGKSTLIKVLAGFNSPEPGSTVRMWGETMAPPLDAARIRKLGVAFVHQHLGLVPSLSVIENMIVTEDHRRSHQFINWRTEHRKLRALFDEFGLDISPDAEVARLSPVERAFVAILRAVKDLRLSVAGRAGEGILVLDEPTPFLSADDVDKLFGLIRNIKKTGASVIIVTHDIDEVKEITDRVAILRDGELAAVMTTAETPRQAILDCIVGRSIAKYERQARSPAGPLDAKPDAPVVITDLRGGRLEHFDFTLKPGEVVGVTGLIGSGFADIPYLLFGASSGHGQVGLAEVTTDVAQMTPAAAVAMGMSFLPGDRISQGGIGALSVTDNATMLSMARTRGPMGLDWAAMTAQVDTMLGAYDVRPRNARMNLGNMSGGNQQKVLLGKWLAEEPRLLLLDEPTQGVDFGARQQIFEALDEASAKGMAILCASTDYEQLAQICDRVVVFARGVAIAELSGAALTKDAIARACFGKPGLILQEAAE
jgi:ribose transport system ATP-binding protein